ncbi:MAG: hypothetical protein K1X75_10595 [Leptospirales bacterium]|nr:hypothetical protein [Leptospirales bacterium]
MQRSVLSAAAAALACCVTASGGIAVSNVPVEGRRFENLGEAQSTVSWWSFDTGIISLPLHEPPVDEAMRQLLTEKSGDALLNLRYWTDRSVFLLFLTRHRFHLKADVIKFTDGR